MFSTMTTRPGLTLLITILLTTACSVKSSPGPVYETEQLAKGFAAAWAARDPDELLSYYSENVRSYDATAYGVTFDYPVIDDVLHGEYASGAFDVSISSFFVSDDGRFVATVGTFSGYVPQPYVSLLEFSEGKIVWAYDYYGGVLSEVLPLQEVPETANQTALSNQAITDTRAMVTEWETAYNDKDAQAFISFYDRQSEYIQVISPEWRVFTVDMLLQEVTSDFSSGEFASSLGDFFISADGHFVAVQGSYKDANTHATPMVIILEVENGKIIEQYDYLAAE